MDYATQLHYTHGVPKTIEPVGERISLAFRVKRPRTAKADDASTARLGIARTPTPDRNL
jgi:hypothetical protein